MVASVPSSEYRFGHFVLQPQARQLLKQGEPMAVGPRAFDLLVALVERAGTLVTKNELLDLVWPKLVVEENNLQVQVSALRKILGPEVIATIPGRGYRFTATLDSAQVNSSTPAAVDDVTSEPAATTGARDSLAAESRRPERSSNLPLHLPPLLGRAEDLQRVRDLILEQPLVTLVGAGGIGKTRLALAVAHQLRDQYADGVWVVELAAVSTPALALVSIAQVLNISLDGDRPPQELLVDALRDQKLLLVIDNCEHLLEPLAAFIDALLASAPSVGVLATSQEPLKLANEHQYRVGALAVPTDADLAHAANHGAVALFVDRARAVDPRFVLSQGNVAAVVDICRRLDGIALAIELAAARVSLLGVSGVRDKLSERFRVLSAGSRLALKRHQTMHAALDWSHSLLSSPEQAVLRRLGVFAGGFSLEEGQALAADDAGIDEWAALDHLGALVDKSLVAVDMGEVPRYRLLETTRAYALERLAEANETDALLKRHAQVMRRIFERCEEQHCGERGTLSTDEFVGRLKPELDNLRAALAWSMGDGAGDDSETALGLASASGEFLSIVGLAPEGLGVLLKLRHRVGDSVDPDLAARYWQALGYLGMNGRVESQFTIAAFANAERILRMRSAPRRLYRALLFKGWVLAGSGRVAEAQALLQESLRLEDPAWPGWLRAVRLNLQARLCDIAGRHADALTIYDEWQALLPVSGEEQSRFTSIVNRCNALNCLQRHAEAAAVASALIEQCSERRLESASMGFALAQLIAALTALGRLEQARDALRDAVSHWRRNGLVLLFCEHIALLAAKQGQYANGARLAGAADAYRRCSGIERVLNEERSRRALLKCFAAAQISQDDMERWEGEGKMLDADAVTALCLNDVAGAPR